MFREKECNLVRTRENYTSNKDKNKSMCNIMDEGFRFMPLGLVSHNGPYILLGFLYKVGFTGFDETNSQLVLNPDLPFS